MAIKQNKLIKILLFSPISFIQVIELKNYTKFISNIIVAIIHPSRATEAKGGCLEISSEIVEK